MIGEGTPFHGTPVSIKIGLLVQIFTTDPPRDPALRRQGYERGIPVSIGENVWIGSGAIIGAESMVTRNVPAGATAIGNVARIFIKDP